MNDISNSQSYKIAGLVFNYFSFNSGKGGGSTISSVPYFMRFRYQPSLNAYPTECLYVDLTFLGIASTTNGNPRIFWKTCDGISGYISLTNYFSVGSIVTTYVPSGAATVATGGTVNTNFN